METPELDAQDRLALLTGRVVREAVDVDGAARTLLATLSGDNPALAWDAPMQVGVTLERCRELLLKFDGFAHGELEACLQSLKEANAAYQERNRYVHDHLLHDAGETWTRVELSRRKAARPTSTTVSESDLERCRKALVAAGWRLWAVHMLVQRVRRPETRSAERDHHVNVLIKGRFRVHRDNTISWNSDDATNLSIDFGRE